MIEDITQFVGIGLAGTLLSAWRAIPILGVVFLADLLFRRRINARFQCGLWLLVLARLVLPISFPSPLSVSEFADRTAERTIDRLLEPAPEPKPEFEVATFKRWNGEMLSVPVLPEGVNAEVRERAMAFAAGVHAKRLLVRNRTPETIPPSREFDEDFIVYPLLWIWAFVSMMIVAVELFKFCRFAKTLKLCPKIIEPAILETIAINRIGERIVSVLPKLPTSMDNPLQFPITHRVHS